MIPRFIPSARVLAGVIAALALLAPAAALASLVYGRVSGGGFAARQSFTVDGNKSVATDDHAQYRVVLEPGTHVVTWQDKQGATWTATITSDSGPIKQDIELRKK